MCIGSATTVVCRAGVSLLLLYWLVTWRMRGMISAHKLARGMLRAFRLGESWLCAQFFIPKL